MDFYQKLRENIIAHPEWRYGQTVWNTACTMYPEFAEPYRATEFDPFYRDNIADTFISKVMERVYEQEQAMAKDS